MGVVKIVVIDILMSNQLQEVSSIDLSLPSRISASAFHDPMSEQTQNEGEFAPPVSTYILFTRKYSN